MSHDLGTHPCGFCGKSPKQVAKLIAGPAERRICEQCIAAFTSSLLDDYASVLSDVDAASEMSVRCGFCGKKRAQVWRLIGATKCAICNECLEICNEILADDGIAEAAGEDRLEQLRKHNRRGIAKGGYVRRMLSWIRSNRVVAI